MWKLSKYEDFSGPYFPEYGKNGPEKTPYLDTFSPSDATMLLFSKER